MAYNNVRIQQKIDTLENWNKDQITLLKGELAVVICNNQIRFKIGNGISAFTELPFVDETQLSTKQVFVQTISQGINNKSAPYGIVGGAYLSADSNFSQVFGVNAQVSSTDPFSFVWSGDNTRGVGEDPYKSHGEGTFSLNPLEGISGVYIGDRDLCAIIGDEDASIKSELCATSCYLSTDILSLSDYTFTIKFALEQLNADFSRLNLDATIMSSNIETLCANAATHINEEQSKYWHYTKWETSSDVEIQNEFDTKTTALSAMMIADNCANNRVNQFQKQFAGISPLDANSSTENIVRTLNEILAFLKPQQPTP